MSETEFSRIPETLKKSAKQLIQANDPQKQERPMKIEKSKYFKKVKQEEMNK